MHAYGTTNGRVVIANIRDNTGRTVNIELSVAGSTSLREQLGVAIREAELKQIRQLSLVFPGEDAA